MAYKNILYEKKDDIAWIILNRPEKLNSMNDLMLKDLDNALIDIEHDIDLKVVIIKGSGRAFCAGQDLSGQETTEVLPHPYSLPPLDELMKIERRRSRRWEYLLNFPKVTIAQIHGYCLGAGLYLALACDLAIASEEAIFGDPSLRMGVVTSFPLWTWYVGIKKAKELVFSGRKVKAKEAEEINLINLAVPEDQLESEVMRYARAICLGPGDGLIVAKEAINANLDMQGIGAAWRFVSDIQLINLMQQQLSRPEEFNFYQTRDQKGLKAAIEERDSPFEGLV